MINLSKLSPFYFFFCVLIISSLGCKDVQLVEPIRSNVDPAILDSTYVSGKTTYFRLENDSIVGSGKEVLNHIFQESQFVLFGERHNSLVTSKLISALIPIMNKNSFQTLGLEVGPHSAKKLEELMNPAGKTVENFKNFHTTYFDERINDVPIPFFSGVEDAEFLDLASKYEMNIWGLDQEYYISALFLTDEILLKAGTSEDIKELKEKTDKVVKEWFIKDKNSEEEVDVFTEILKDADVQSFFNMASERSDDAANIIKDLKISWDIYTRWQNDSHADRISYMRNNFSNCYDREIEKNGKRPKVFLKFGQVHTSQQISINAYDLGHYLNEIAKKDDHICTNINSWHRVFLEDEREIDYFSEYQDFYRRYTTMTSQSKRNEWTIINLKSIRDDLEKDKIKLPQNGDFHKLNALIQSYDYQFILPIDKDPTFNI